MTDATPGGSGWAPPGGRASSGPVPYEPPPVPLPTSPLPASPLPGWGGPSAGSGGSSPGPGWTQQPGWGAAGATAPQPGVVPLRPLGLGEVLDGAVALVRGYPRAALGVSAVVALATTLIQLVLLFTVLRPLFHLDTTTLDTGNTDELFQALGGLSAGVSISAVVGSVAGAVMTGFLSAIAGAAVLGQPLSLGQVWQRVSGKLPRLVGAAAVYGLAVYGPLVLAGVLTALAALVSSGLAVLTGVVLGPLGAVLGVLFYVRFSLACSALVLEDASLLTSLRRSNVLAKRSFWRILGILLLTFVISSFVAQVVQVPFLFLGDGNAFSSLTSPTGEAPGTTALVLTTLGAGLASALITPFTAGVRALLYVDRRMRAEGLDVALQAAAGPRP